MTVFLQPGRRALLKTTTAPDAAAAPLWRRTVSRASVTSANAWRLTGRPVGTILLPASTTADAETIDEYRHCCTVSAATHLSTLKVISLHLISRQNRIMFYSCITRRLIQQFHNCDYQQRSRPTVKWDVFECRKQKTCVIIQHRSFKKQALYFRKNASSFNVSHTIKFLTLINDDDDARGFNWSTCIRKWQNFSLT